MFHVNRGLPPGRNYIRRSSRMGGNHLPLGMKNSSQKTSHKGSASQSCKRGELTSCHTALTRNDVVLINCSSMGLVMRMSSRQESLRDLFEWLASNMKWIQFISEARIYHSLNHLCLECLTRCHGTATFHMYTFDWSEEAKSFQHLHSAPTHACSWNDERVATCTKSKLWLIAKPSLWTWFHELIIRIQPPLLAIIWDCSSYWPI